MRSFNRNDCSIYSGKGAQFEPVFATISWALTSGPTAPEYTSFEPVDTTDMVNLQSGDFTYNIPLLNVPSPEGGFPVSMSYHAGIMPNEEASWVGLGWTLNPGAINRTVNMFPDDHNGQKSIISDYWQGGNQSTVRVGLSVGPQAGIANLGVGIGLEFSQDTYKGFGVGASVSASARLSDPTEQVQVGVNANVGVGSYGQVYGSAGIGLSSKSAGVGVGIGITTNFQSVGGYTGVYASQDGQSLGSLGASISSEGLKPSWSVGGTSFSQTNNQGGIISSYGFSFSAPIPLGNTGLFGSIGYSYQRYWIDESDDIHQYGSLHFQDATYSSIPSADGVMDSYILRDPQRNIIEHPDPEWTNGGSYAAYDNYNVLAQGISGSIQPYQFEQAGLYRQTTEQNSEDGDFEYYKTLYVNFTGQLGYSIDEGLVNPTTLESITKEYSKPVNFRFKNDFSNYLKQSFGNLSYDQYPAEIVHPGTPTQTTSAGLFSVENGSQDYVSDGFNINDQGLAGSRDIKWYTNEELRNSVLGIITPEGYSYQESKHIGGFVVTSENGMKYHFTQPVYTSEGETFTHKLDDEGNEISRTEKKLGSYAYTWLLQAITGPDFVDKNANNQVDEQDWGYWVGFDYSFWAKHNWRNPAIGTKIDIDNETETYSRGTKEIYYLDAIRTRSHTALFVKEARDDAKEVSRFFSEIRLDGVVNDQGGFDPVTINAFETESGEYCRDIFGGTPCPGECTEQYTEIPRMSMKLNKILLFNNSDLREAYQSDSYLDVIRGNGSVNYFQSFQLCGAYKETIYSNMRTPFLIDEADFDNQVMPVGLLNKVIRQVDFNTSYELAPNSFNNFLCFGNNTGFSLPITLNSIYKYTSFCKKYLSLSIIYSIKQIKYSSSNPQKMD